MTWENHKMRSAFPSRFRPLALNWSGWTLYLGKPLFWDVFILSGVVRDCQPPKKPISLFLAQVYIRFLLYPRRAILLKTAI